MGRIDDICSVRKRRCVCCIDSGDINSFYLFIFYFRTYEIKSADAVLARIILFKNVFKVGENIVGMLEFPGKDVYCLQVNFSAFKKALIIDTSVHKYKFFYKKFFVQILIRAETVETNLLDDSRGENTSVHSSEHMVTAFVKETYFKVPLYMNAVPSFTTESG